MARQKTVDTTYKRVRIKNPKTGKTQYKFVKTNKVVTKATNVSKGANTGSRPWQSDKAALASEKITADLSAQKAKFASRTANVAAITNAASNIARNVANAAAPQKSTEQVEQAVKGGITTSSPSRDEDDEEEDNPYIV